MDDRIAILLQMLDVNSGHPDFAKSAIEALKTKFGNSTSFYANAERMRVASMFGSKNHFVDPFVIATSIGYAYAIFIVREWQSMIGKCESATFSEGPKDGSCKG